MSNTFNGKYGVTREFAKFARSYSFDRLQFIGGCGFELRTTRILEQLSRLTKGGVECTFVDLLNRRDRNFHKAKKLQRPNMAQTR